jgi:hypothetical protein
MHKIYKVMKSQKLGTILRGTENEPVNLILVEQIKCKVLQQVITKKTVIERSQRVGDEEHLSTYQDI